MTYLARMAWIFLRSSGPGARWRVVGIALAGAVLGLLTQIGGSILALTEAQDRRTAALGTELSREDAASDVFVQVEFSIWRTQRIQIAWLQPAGSSATHATAAGMATFPEPGQAYVSPALAALIADNPPLAQRFPRIRVLDHSGVRSGADLIAYVRPSEGVRLGPDPIRIEDRRVVGAGPAARLSALQGGRHGTVFATGESAPTWNVINGLIAGLLVPGLLFLFVACRGVDPRRDHRFAVLSALGVPPTRLRMLGATESTLVAVPAVLVASAAWAWASPGLTRVPGRSVAPGDLQLPATVAAGVCASTIAVAVLVALIAQPSPYRSSGRRADRAAISSRRGTWWPLLVALGMLAAHTLVRGLVQEAFVMIGAVGMLVGTVMALPRLAGALGSVLGRSRWAVTSLSGRLIQWAPGDTVRPFLGMSMLIVVMCAIAGVFALGIDPALARTATPPSGVAAAVVEWDENTIANARRLRDAVPAAVLVSLTTTEAPGGEVEAQLSADCATLRAVLPVDECRGRTLSSEGEAELREALAWALGRPIAGVDLDSRAPKGGGNALVMRRGDMQALDEDVRTAAMRFPIAHIETGVFRLTPPAQASQQWVVLVSSLGGLALGLACVVSMVDRAILPNRRQRRLTQLGAGPRTLRLLSALLFGIPYACAITLGLAVGTAVCRIMVRGDIAMPWAYLAGTAAVALVVGTGGVAVSAFTSTARSTPRRTS